MIYRAIGAISVAVFVYVYCIWRCVCVCASYMLVRSVLIQAG